MPTISEQLTQLASDRDDLVTNLTTKGITGLTGDETFTELVPEVLNIPGGGGGETPEPEEKDVNFYDYDGTRVYSYTASEFANLTEMPENPSHTGLTAQGWNWTLSDAKTYVTNVGFLDIGQHYQTDNGKTKIYINLYAPRQIRLNLKINGTATISWGDGSNDSTITGTSISNVSYTTHDYESGGNYTISIDTTSATACSLSGSSSTQGVFDVVNQKVIRKVEMGNNINISGYSFYNCYNLETISMKNPTSSLGLGNYTFYGCYSLKALILPPNYSGFGTQCCRYCSSLKRVSFTSLFNLVGERCFETCSCLKIKNIPNNITNIGQEAFKSCYGIESLIFQSTIEQMPNSFSSTNPQKIVFLGTPTNVSATFSGASDIRIYDFSNCTSIPPLTTSTSLGTMHSDGKIIVPDALYEDWKATNYWSSYASYIVKASEA